MNSKLVIGVIIALAVGVGAGYLTFNNESELETAYSDLETVRSDLEATEIELTQVNDNLDNLVSDISALQVENKGLQESVRAYDALESLYNKLYERASECPNAIREITAPYTRQTVNINGEINFDDEYLFSDNDYFETQDYDLVKMYLQHDVDYLYIALDIDGEMQGNQVWMGFDLNCDKMLNALDFMFLWHASPDGDPANEGIPWIGTGIGVGNIPLPDVIHQTNLRFGGYQLEFAIPLSYFPQKTAGFHIRYSPECCVNYIWGGAGVNVQDLVNDEDASRYGSLTLGDNWGDAFIQLVNELSLIQEEYDALETLYNELYADYQIVNSPQSQFTTLGDLEITLTTDKTVYNYTEPITGNVSIYYKTGEPFKGLVWFNLRYAEGGTTAGDGCYLTGENKYRIDTPAFEWGPGIYTIQMSSIQDEDRFRIATSSELQSLSITLEAK